uniref:Uncharacterized protein n=1 Tax=Esox lucius TaxID=8010 RepID=A0A6Q2YXC1_ESOLU
MSKNRRFTLIFGGFITAVAAAFYPIFFHPLAHTDDYIFQGLFSCSVQYSLMMVVLGTPDSNTVTSLCKTIENPTHFPAEQVQRENRAGINQADVQPVGVKVWSDPYKPK